MSTFNIGKYLIYRKRIGKGSFSTVYKGIDSDTGKVCAVKEINLDNLDKHLDNIKKETNLLRKLNHRNIVKLYDVVFDKVYNNVYLILEYQENGDLSKFLNKKPLKEMYAKKYLKQLADGLKYLLDNNILHRDLKPQNILLTNNYDLKITDFGFARHVDKNKEMVIQTLCGTPMYMAPEIMKYKKYDIKSDLWSVGVIMYQMLFGKLPYDAKNFLDLIKSIEKKPIKLPDYIDISEGCKDLLFKLLNKEPRKRINWNEFFEHYWFDSDETIDDENKLLQIDMNSTLPSLSEFNLNKTQFCSFKHKSIKDIDNLDELDSNFMPHFDSSNDTNSNTDSKNSSNYDSDNESEMFSSTESFKSTSDNTQHNQVIDTKIKKKITKSEPINIVNPNKNRNLFVSNNTYEMINTLDYNGMSDPTHNKSLTESLKGYLYSSIQFLQQSYNYISSNSKSL